MRRKIGIIGKGHVGSALQRGLEQAGYEVKVTGKGNGVRETAGWGEVLILAVPYTAVDAALAAMGNAVDGKTVVDVTNKEGKNNTGLGLSICPHIIGSHEGLIFYSCGENTTMRVRLPIYERGIASPP